MYISQDPIGLAGGNPTLYGYVKDSNCWVDVFGLELINGQSLSDETKVFRIGGASIDNLKLKDAEKKLNPPGISVIRANDEKEAGDIMKKAFPKATKLHEQINSGNIAEMKAKDIREVGFDVIHNPTENIGEPHARIIHPEGVTGFNNDNLEKLSNKCNQS